MEKLEIIKMGCNFFKNDARVKESDFTNYRYFINNIQLKEDVKEKYNIDKNWKLATMEISRTDNIKITNGKIKTIDECTMWVNLYFRDKEDICHGGGKFERDLENLKLKYTKANLLYLINKISKIQYTNIVETSNFE